MGMGTTNRDRPVAAVILDMDGVITRTATLHARVWKQMFDAYLAERGNRDRRIYMPFGDDDYTQYVDGKPRYEGVHSFLESRGIDLPHGMPDDPPAMETVCGLGNRKNELFHQLIRQTGVDVYEDTLEQLDRWKRQGLKLAVISSSRNCEEILTAAGVLDRFEVKIDGDDLMRLETPGKPAPDMFLQAAAQLGVEPEEAVVIEDALAGVQAGRAGGFAHVIGVARKGNAQQLKQQGADWVVADLRELGDFSQLIASASNAADSPPPLPALRHFDELTEQLRGRRLALFLDYDGTLTPIVDRPEDATLPGPMRSLLTELSEQVTVAIVSGRDLADVQQMVALENLVYAGSHGFDIAGPGGLQLQHAEAQALLPDLDAAEQKLQQRLASIDGVRIERKRFAIAIHYRLAAAADLPRIETAVGEVQREHPALRKKGGKKIFELQPDVPWNKGHAVLWLRQTLQLDRPDVLTVYLGDDETDEDAFAAIVQADVGLGIIVGLPERPTAARYYLEDCEQLQRLLQALLELIRGDKSRDEAV